MTDVEQGKMLTGRQSHSQVAEEGVSHLKDTREPTSRTSGVFEKIERVLRKGRVEAKGIHPVPVEDRTSTRYWNIFTVWCSMNTNILGVLFGLLGPQVYGLSLRDSALVILFFCMLSTCAPAYLATLGPKTGMRQMIQARYSFGRYLVSIPVLLNLATLTGFIIIICVIGGQCLSAISDGYLTPNAGIVVISLLGLLISFCGFRVLHYYETYAFIPAVITIAIATGCGGSDLKKQAEPPSPGAGQYVTYGMVVASYMIPWAAIASDLTTYFDPRVPSWRVFAYTWSGLALPTILLMTLGSAIAGALPNVPEWQTAYDENLVGGILAAMLKPTGSFGKFVVAVLALTLLGNTAGTMYAITLNFQTLVPWAVRIPRYVFAVVVTAIIIPVAVRVVSANLLLSLENFIALIGYWSAAYTGIAVVEHVVFRRKYFSKSGKVPYPDAYDHAIWSQASKLPTGLAAIGAALLSCGLLVPCMAQVWFTGPIAKTTGDLGFEVAFVLSAILYVPLRSIERRWIGR
ncbi:permease [Emericellopsis atlantica]|uniref:Permease n=1 Tax=Emericellopsis atlantica TaxID=2614577 RepID=A0A9P7ZDT0_9HYPO|nr:permease [Emericellopsis atlantica]KAG9249603.1 permease [Emericellopsis atlantica]